ncbi:glycosyltransferase family 2 protein [Avibacterium sp. 21-599]|uniref:glycosyltransferase family 2 protein n=1 Tax=Avibacterium sp. 21-599 TaxID=2911528 RepID=UPI002246C3CF|nr:glycosyltransferase [Avibacterium sp. 21-599]MCW9718779.1 glycosyltransferase [Avibacterium sp. 21-599]
MKIALFVPTYNPGMLWESWIQTYQRQKVKADKVIIIDSSSQDRTVELSKHANFKVTVIPTNEFNHGETRNLSASLFKDADIFVFLTQDALLSSPFSLQKIIEPFLDSQVGAVYGRQLPHKDANPLATHARLFNYPDKTIIKSQEDIARLGIKTVFISNSFAAYRASLFRELGGFPDNVIMAEDMHLAARIIGAGYKIAYSAKATVHHSHNYTPWQEFKRYFDTGVFQKQENWIQEKFGKPTGEGRRFVLSEMKYLMKSSPSWIPRAILTTLLKFVGYKLGLHYDMLPISLIRFFSMHKQYWNK